MIHFFSCEANVNQRIIYPINLGGIEQIFVIKTIYTLKKLRYS